MRSLLKVLRLGLERGRVSDARVRIGRVRSHVVPEWRKGLRGAKPPHHAVGIPQVTRPKLDYGPRPGAASQTITDVPVPTEARADVIGGTAT